VVAGVLKWKQGIFTLAAVSDGRPFMDYVGEERVVYKLSLTRLKFRRQLVDDVHDEGLRTCKRKVWLRKKRAESWKLAQFQVGPRNFRGQCGCGLRCYHELLLFRTSGNRREGPNSQIAGSQNLRLIWQVECLREMEIDETEAFGCNFELVRLLGYYMSIPGRHMRAFGRCKQS